MLRYGKRFRRRREIKTVYLWILFILVLFSLGYYYFNTQLFPIIKSLAVNKANIVAEEIITNSVDKIMNKDAVTYDSLMTFEKNEDNEITAIKSNTLAMNNLKIDVTEEILKELDNIDDDKLDIPIGNIFGGIIFLNKGPSFNVKLSPVGSVTSDFSSVFTSSGINQTHQQVMLNIKADILIILSSTYSINQSISTSICIADTIIVGDVPEVYLNPDEIS